MSFVLARRCHPSAKWTPSCSRQRRPNAMDTSELVVRIRSVAEFRGRECAVMAIGSSIVNSAPTSRPQLPNCETNLETPIANSKTFVQLFLCSPRLEDTKVRRNISPGQPLRSPAWVDNRGPSSELSRHFGVTVRPDHCGSQLHVRPRNA